MVFLECPSVNSSGTPFLEQYSGRRRRRFFLLEQLSGRRGGEV
jgi:hypothetical protein